LTAGLCGPDAALGLWLPSVDRAGRYFPLALAGLIVDANSPQLIAGGAGFLMAAETAARDALADDLPPEALAARLAAAPAAPSSGPGIAWLKGENIALG
jgi:type VI secretion system protein ImpM